MQFFLRIQRLGLLVHPIGIVQCFLGHPPHHISEGLELGDRHLDDVVLLSLFRWLLGLRDEGALPIPDGGFHRLFSPHLSARFLLLRLLVGTNLAHLRRPFLLLAQGLLAVGVPQGGGHLLLNEPLRLLLFPFGIRLRHRNRLRFPFRCLLRFRRILPLACGLVCFRLRRLPVLLGRRGILLLQGFL